MSDRHSTTRSGNYIHGHKVGRKPSRTYTSWNNMWLRCECRSSNRYHSHGGRGIRVCERWVKFENFLADMGERPVGHTLERKDNDGDYTPDNCRWATPREQSNNTRRNRKLTLNGRTLNVIQWARELGIGRTTIENRIDNCGWTVEEALTTPVRR